VLPDMRDEMLILVADLKSLVELRKQAADATLRVKTERDTIMQERERLAVLIEARQNQAKVSQGQLESEAKKVADLGREAKSLKELISRTENEIVGAAKASEMARRAPAPARSAQELASLRPDAFKDAARLQPRLAFQDAKGLMSLPVSGKIIRNFGVSDGLGGVERGITIESAKEALVTNPVDGWVLFAGPYRGYGSLLIINAGNGYHVVLAGMERLSVEIGQFVLAGEPVGTLGLSPAIQFGGGFAGDGLGPLKPALYVEFRKDGSPVDPTPWWTHHSAEKARG
jgi:murein hydrolase activator